ncbi:hypothetical protein QM012_008312 [Aureobasidium pullulans]|uniref:Uncharacterized protein n=1 Tax=Aureobasidium pullulans TaxID=5580 RepID=A0ABR0TKJ4_AURPU
MAPKHSLDEASPPSDVKRVRSEKTSIVKRNYRTNFARLCALHKWTPSEVVHDKLAALLHLSGPRLKASELLPLAFVQHYPFIWVKGFLLLGYNDADQSVWYKAYPTGRGIARGRYYNSAQVGILGKHTVTKFWQSWVDVFDIENRGLNRTHEYFTGVYLILKKFPNLRYKSGKIRGDARNPQMAIRATGVAEYPFNDEHPFMQKSSELNEVENNVSEVVLGAETEGQNDEQERTGSHEDEHRSYFLPRQLSKQLASRGDSSVYGLVSPQRHNADDQQGPPVETDGLASPFHYSIMQPNSRLDSSFLLHSPEHGMDKQAGLQHDTHDLLKQPTFRPHLCEQGSPSLLQSDKKTANNYEHSKKAVPLSFPNQPSRPSRTIRAISAVHSTRSLFITQPGPHIEDDDEPAPEFQQSPKTPTSHGASPISKATTSPYFARTKSQPPQQKIPSKPTQKFKEIAVRVPIDEPRWSNSNFEFAAVNPISTAPEEPVFRTIEE